ncbi:ArnT family glycosyltransferase [Nitrospira sp. Nam80]
MLNLAFKDSASLFSLNWEVWARSRWLHAIILIPVAWLAFFHNLGLSLFEGSEGLYAHIAHEMVKRGDYIHLTYVGEAYANKSPFFFWVLALSTALFGESEIALRLPGALFCAGTMALTYGLGLALFSSTAAFWAALVTATTHVFLWYGRRVLFDSMLAFFITLALLCWVRAYFQKAGPRWYALCFIPMALATMTKGLHGLALPLLVIVGFLVIVKDFEPLKTRSFWAGLLLYFVTLTAYVFLAQIEWGGHSLLSKSSIVSLTAPSGGHPVYWYLGVMWFDFFPWSAVLPVGLLLLVAKDSSTPRPARIFVLTWFLGFLLMFSLSPLKRESYLIPMVPALGLVVGYCCRQVGVLAIEKRAAARVLSLLLGVLGVLYLLAVTFGPGLLHRKWNIPSDLFPLWFVLGMAALALALLYAATRLNMSIGATALGASSILFVVGVVHLIMPAIDATNSARDASQQIKLLAQHSADPVHLYTNGWPNNEDLIYYLNVEPALPWIPSTHSFMERLRAEGKVLFVADKHGYRELSERKDVNVTLLQEFPQWRSKNVYLLSARVEESRIAETDSLNRLR